MKEALAVLEDGYVVYVAQASGERMVRMFTEVGNRVHPHSTAVGKVLLAHQPREVVESILGRLGMPAATPNTITDIERFMNELDRVREQGYAVDLEEQEEGVSCIAVPVAPVDGWVAAMSVSGPSGRLGEERRERILAAEYPYEQWAGHFYQAMEWPRFVRLGTEAARLGLRISCLVSRDLEYALSGYEAIDREVPIRDRRWVVVHVNQATDDQLRRMRALGIVATATPGFLAMASDRYGLDRLGTDGVPLRRLLDAGVPVALGTDGVPPSMLWTAWQALARWDEETHAPVGESGLTREEALRIAVQTGHVLTWSEDRAGTLEPGKVADFVILGDNPLTCAQERLKDLPVEMTIVGGEVVANVLDIGASLSQRLRTSR